MLAYKLAIKNLLGAGLRTWLNVAVLSMSYVVIIFYNGLLEGWNLQARRDTIDWETGGGQLWNSKYDPYDPFTLIESSAPTPKPLLKEVEKKNVTPVLISLATIYPNGRMQTVQLKGIDPGQSTVKIPSRKLEAGADEITAVIGKRMAKEAKLKNGDVVLARWRDKDGTFDAANIRIVDIFDSNVPTIDNGQIWISLGKLREITGLENEATLLILGKNYDPAPIPGWTYKGLDFLLKDINMVIESKRASSSIIYILLLAIALIAIFDTQALSIFRRQKEIGTYVALGMTRGQTVALFTIEGAAHSVLAALLGAVYGIPLFVYLANRGFEMPSYAGEAGLTIASRIFPVYGVWLILGTLVLIVLSATIVSFIPARKIAKIKPTEALKGKLQ